MNSALNAKFTEQLFISTLNMEKWISRIGRLERSGFQLTEQIVYQVKYFIGIKGRITPYNVLSTQKWTLRTAAIKLVGLF